MIDTDAAHSTDEWCGHALFTPLAARREVARLMERLRLSVRAFVESAGLDDVNVYVSGSLARGEPTVAAGGPNAYRLVSDIDLMAVVQGDSTDGHPVGDLEPRLRAACPELDPTVFVAPSAGIGSLRSFFARDLCVAFDRPLVAGFPLAPPAPPQVGEAEQFEVLAHHLAAWLLGPAAEGDRSRQSGHGAAYERELARVRLLADCLWILRDVPEGGTVRYADVCRRGGAPRGRAEREEAERIVRAHEVFSPANGTSRDVIGRLTDSLALFLGCADTAPGTGRTLRVVEALTERALRGHDLLAVFAWSLPLYALSGARSARVRRPAAAGFEAAWQGLDPGQLVAGQGAFDRLNAVGGDRLAADPAVARAELAGPLRALRKDYYHHLGARNFGRDRG